LTFACSDGDRLLDVAAGGKVNVNAPVESDGLLYVNAAQSGATRGTAGEVVFGVGFALLLPRFFGLDGVLYSMPVSDALTFIISAALILRTRASLERSGFTGKSAVEML
jgi:hypothetical protein